MAKGEEVCHFIAAGWLFSPGTQIASFNKTDRHEHILLKYGGQ